jgi:arabinogalactan endo-1,4-beta-galactosidase
VETSYNYAEGAAANDDANRAKLPYGVSPQGQKRFLDKLMRTVAAIPEHHGKGVVYWEPAWINGSKWQGPDWSAEWEPRALFDEQGNALPAMEAFRFLPNSR